MEKAKSIFLNDKLTLGMNCMSLGMMIIFAFIRNPMNYTISSIGLEHRPLFYVLCIVWGFTGLINQLALFDKFEMKSKLFVALIWTVNLATIIIAYSDNGLTDSPWLIVHWITAFMYMAGNPLIVLRGVIHRIRSGYKKYIGAIIAFVALYFGDLGSMAVIFIKNGADRGKNGVLELVPISLLFVMFILFNHTSVCEPESKIVATECKNTIQPDMKTLAN